MVQFSEWQSCDMRSESQVKEEIQAVMLYCYSIILDMIHFSSHTHNDQETKTVNTSTVYIPFRIFETLESSNFRILKL